MYIFERKTALRQRAAACASPARPARVRPCRIWVGAGALFGTECDAAGPADAVQGRGGGMCGGIYLHLRAHCLEIYATRAGARRCAMTARSAATAFVSGLRAQRCIVTRAGQQAQANWQNRMAQQSDATRQHSSATPLTAPQCHSGFCIRKGTASEPCYAHYGTVSHLANRPSPQSHSHSPQVRNIPCTRAALRLAAASRPQPLRPRMRSGACPKRMPARRADASGRGTGAMPRTAARTGSPL